MLQVGYTITPMVNRIPDHNDWKGYQQDLGVKYMYKLFFGQCFIQAMSHFGDSRSIERADELLFCPRNVFQYYIFSFANFILSKEAKGDSDSASSFLTFLKIREQKDPGSVAAIYPQLKPVIEYVARNQAYFEADIDVYGHFKHTAKEVYQLCNK
ncbi:hypothetical protein [Marinicella rhabdoformis]|uniref:hypothetical protein n=1 Tax=Marinicella rhabdoformis TaxID=2580566 RepID=UPI0012AEC707|nr:hypothetical protein [Marinicella rhabdoformis]